MRSGEHQSLTLSVRASATLTASEVESASVDVDGWGAANVDLFYAQAAAGRTLNVYIDVSADDDTWLPADTALDYGTPSGGQVDVGLAEQKYTMDATGNRTVRVPVRGRAYLRIRAAEPGTGAFGTLSASVVLVQNNG